MQLPQEVITIITALQKAGFEAYAVGGCVRDLLLGKTPKDWDVTTSATPEEIQQVFPKSFYANTFGTVTVLMDSQEPTLQQIEVTTFRVDSGYSDQRHPDKVEFTRSIKEDLARRDFTINAMALTPSTEAKSTHDTVTIEGWQVFDPFGGLQDLHVKVIRAVGDPAERFQEDALRLLRAVRLACQLDFTIEEKTLEAIQERKGNISAVSHERIRDELVKIVMTSNPEKGIRILQETGLLQYILPEVAEGVGVEQNKHHIFTVFEHCIKSLQFAAEYDYDLPIRLATLFHDIGKPRTKKFMNGDNTFYAHEIVGARMTEKLMERLKFSREMIDKVSHLVRQHMFYYDVGKVTEAGARRLLRRVGKDHFADLIKLRIAERKGSGVPKARPYRLRHLEFMVEKVSQQAITTSDLKINGHDLMTELAMKPGPIFGGILNALLGEVIENPEKNTKEYLLKRAQELTKEDPNSLKALGAAAVEDEERKREEVIRRKYHI